MVAPALDGYVVVAIVEMHILNKDITTHFRVDTIIVHQLGIEAYASQNGILRLQQVDAPEGRIGDEYILDGDTFTTVQLDEVRPQIIAFSEIAFRNRCSCVVHIP